MNEHHAMKNIILIGLGLLILLAGIMFWGASLLDKYTVSKNIETFEACVDAGYPVMESYPQQCRRPDGKTFTENIGNELEKLDLIRIASPRPNEVVTPPLSIIGTARGTWFFEASFPITLKDANGNILVEHYATAEGEWMTENFVPFSSVLAFTPPQTETGTLILKKDNPSGLPEYDDELIIPIRFSSKETTTVQAYFTNNYLDPEDTCIKVFPVTRTIPKTESIGKAAVNELLKGPTFDEKKEEYSTNINEGVLLQSLTIVEGTAYADFNQKLNEGVAGSCRVSAIRAQIEQTLLQFPTVQTVIISINGETEAILEP